MTSISINTDEKSPFYFVTFKAADGKYKRRSTKVPAAGGMFQGVKLSKAQAEKRALIEGTKIAEASQLEFESFDNRPIKDIFDLMLDGKLGRVTAETYNNARGSYKVFARWAGSRFSQPMRMWTRADMKEFVLWRRGQVRKETCRKDMAAIKAAFEWAVDSEIIPKNPCAKIAIPSDTKDEKIVHEAFTWGL